MKRILSIVFFACITSMSLLAQDPPPPPNPTGGNSGNPLGGGAPVGSGLAILLALGAGYGVRKVYKMKKE